MPPPGAILTRLKQGAHKNLHTQAHRILRYIKQIPLDEANHDRYKAALLAAQKFISEDADDDKTKADTTKADTTKLAQ